MLSVAIVDDEAAERQKLGRYLQETARQRNMELCVDYFESADVFLMQYQKGYDLVFMDIEFRTGQNGMQAAHALRRIDSTVVLIFVTNMAQMAVNGYAVDALDFIVKPVEPYSFHLKMVRAFSRIDASNSNRITLRQDGDLCTLRVSLIRYLTVEGHYVTYHSREGEFSEYISLAAAEKKLGDSPFFRCDRGCLVNLRYVTEIKKDACVVDGDELFIARTQRTQFLKAYVQYLSGTRQERKNGTV